MRVIHCRQSTGEAAMKTRKPPNAEENRPTGISPEPCDAHEPSSFRHQTTMSRLTRARYPLPPRNARRRGLDVLTQDVDPPRQDFDGRNGIFGVQRPHDARLPDPCRHPENHPKPAGESADNAPRTRAECPRERAIIPDPRAHDSAKAGHRRCPTPANTQTPSRKDTAHP